MSLRQTNFGGGELDPLLHGRTDLPLFGVGLRTCLNFLITKTGAAMSRPGSTYVSNLLFSEPGGPTADENFGHVRLIGFEASNETSYVLEFTNQAIRFYVRGGRLLDGVGSHLTVTTYTDRNGVVTALPWTWATLPYLQVARIGDVLIIVGAHGQPIELRRHGHTDWRLRELDLSRPSPLYGDVGSSTVTTGFAFVTVTPGTHGTTADATHPAREWKWMVTVLVQDRDTGEKFETAGELVTKTWNGTDYDSSDANLASDSVAVYSDKSVTLRRGVSATTPATPPWRVLGYNIYRGRGELFGFVGTTTSRSFVDTGDEPNYAKQPPRGTDPFFFITPLGFGGRLTPGSVAHFQNRRWFGLGGASLGGRTQIAPGVWVGGEDGEKAGSLLGSASSDFFNFDGARVLNMPGQSIEFLLASNTRESIRHLVPQRRLVVGTSTSWWMVHGGQGQPIDYNHIEVERIDEVGADFVHPLEVDKAILYVRTKGIGARALLRNGEDYEPADISAQARHLFEGQGKRIVDWAYQEDPWGVVWVVREDGVLLSLTFSRNGVAWARHETDGEVEAVCCVPEGDEDGVYITVKREVIEINVQGKRVGLTTRRYLERLTSRHPRGGAEVLAGDALQRPPDYICLDSALSYVGGAVSTFTGLWHLEGKQVYVLAEGHPVYGPFEVRFGEVDVGATLEARSEREDGVQRLVAFIGMKYECDLELLDIAGAEARAKHKQVSHVVFEVSQSKGVAVGQDFEHLDIRPSRDVTDAYNAPSLKTQVVRCPIKGHSDLSARACLRQTQPLPVTVIAFQRVVKAGDGA